MITAPIAGLREAVEAMVAASIPATVPPSSTVVVVAGAIAAVLVLGLWSITGHIITIAHEGAHAAVAVLLGGKVTEVRLHRDRTGSTTSGRALLVLPVAAAGYLGPSVFGLLGSGLIVHGRPDLVLWTSLALLFLLLLTTANWFGRLVVITTGALLLATLYQGSPGLRLLVACAWVWVLLIGGLLHVWRHRRGGVDFMIMHSITGVVPAFLWAGLALVATAAALVLGGAWLVGAATPPL